MGPACSPSNSRIYTRVVIRSRSEATRAAVIAHDSVARKWLQRHIAAMCAARIIYEDSRGRCWLVPHAGGCWWGCFVLSKVWKMMGVRKITTTIWKCIYRISQSYCYFIPWSPYPSVHSSHRGPFTVPRLRAQILSKSRWTDLWQACMHWQQC